MIDILTYVAIFIGFVVVVYYINKMNVAKINEQVTIAEANNQMPELAEIFGLNYTSLKDEGRDKRTIINTGDLVSGEYEGVSIEIFFKSNSSHSTETAGPHSFAYTYSAQRTIAFDVDNPQKRKFELSPKNERTVSNPIGDAQFDEKFSFSGNFELTEEFRQYCVNLGWMHLRLKDDKLVFLDDYTEATASGYDRTTPIADIKKAFASRDAMMSAVHPIWNTSMNNSKMDLSRFKELIDQLILIAKSV